MQYMAWAVARFCFEPQDIFTLTCAAHPPTRLSARVMRVAMLQEKQQYIYNLLEEEGCNHWRMKKIRNIAFDTKYDP